MAPTDEEQRDQLQATSDEDLQSLQQENEDLRQKIAEAASQQAENEAARLREMEALQLQAENTRLKAQLARAEYNSSPETSEASAASVIDQAKASLENAQAVADQPLGPVDTNAEDQPEGTTGAVEAVEDGVVRTLPDGTSKVMTADEASAYDADVEAAEAELATPPTPSPTPSISTTPTHYTS